MNSPWRSLQSEYNYALTEEDEEEIEERISRHLNKIYEFETTECSLPTKYFTTPVWQLKSLLKLKKELNGVKSKLNNYNLEKWHTHTHRTNTGGLIVRQVRSLKVELLTQAWCKFYDILDTFALIAPQSRRLNTIHLCEAPGAFVAALNHKLRLDFPQIEWQWRATTLNPYYEGNPLQRMINDDRFVKETFYNWLFGEDHTGNICHLANVLSLKENAAKLGPIHMVTADGSFDCTDDPGEQEKMVAHLVYCETFAALNILSVGGSFVLKIFTTFECSTVCLLYLLRCLFKKLVVYKPKPSKEGNSELYVICQNYKGWHNYGKLLEEMSNRMEKATAGPAMFDEADVPIQFLNEVQNCATFFTGIQMEVIKRNISLFKKKNARNRAILYQIRKRIAEIFVEKHNIRSIAEDCHLVGNQNLTKKSIHISPREQSGSFAEKQYLTYNDDSALIEFYQSKLSDLEFNWSAVSEDLQWILSHQIPAILPDPRAVVRWGKPFETALSSRFCLGTVLNIFNDINKRSVPVQSYDFWNDPSTSQIVNSMLNLGFTEFNTVDVRHLPWILKYHDAQHGCLKSLKSILYNMQMGNNILLIGLPLLTQFNVGLVYVLARNFKRIGFAFPEKWGYCIVFEDLQSSAFDDLHSILKDVDEEKGQQLISLIEFNAFSESYLNCVISYNQILLRKSALMLALSSRNFNALPEIVVS